jgi:beta-galactosidase/beta-glucuronidase
VNLNGEWEFGAGDAETFDRRIVVPFCPQAELSGIHTRIPGDVVWYRRRFDAPPADRLLLHFGAVDYRASVWINGGEVMRHEGGHTPFSVDISKSVRERDNVVVVRAEDPLADKTIPRGKQYWKDTSESIFYTPTTGIWQTVWLEPLPLRSIESLQITPDMDRGEVDVTIQCDGAVETIASFGGREVGRRAGSGRMPLTEVHLWSPETPNLYGLDVSLRDARGNELDRVQTYFGLRRIETRDGKVLLNGRPYVQRLVLDQGYFPGGLMTAPSDGDLRGDIELAKAMGFNGARKHQKIEDPRWLYWADTLGFLVWAEMANFQEDSAEARRRLTAEWTDVVLRDRDHPCIVTWVPCNESFGLGTNPGSFLEGLRSLTKGLDPTRLFVSNDGWEHATSDMCTLHDYATADVLRQRYRNLESALDPNAREKAPYLPGYSYHGEPVVVSEFGGVALYGSPGFGWSEAKGAGGLLSTYGEMVGALMEPGPVEGFCYTQLTDIEQEQNGLLTFDRVPKVDPGLLRRLTTAPKQA